MKSLTDRRNALEDAFFAKQDAVLRRRLVEADETKAGRAALAAASGIKNEMVLNRLLNMKITGSTLSALSMVPLVLVAWADGSIDDKERRAVLSAAEKAGLGKNDPSYQLFEGWLAKKPPAELAIMWKAFVSALCETLGDDMRHTLKTEVLGHARAVAHASGGFMGLGTKVSAAENAVIADLEKTFAAA